MVKQPVEKDSRHHAVTHHLGLSLEDLIGSDKNGALLIELADHVEEEVPSGSIAAAPSSAVPFRPRHGSPLRSALPDRRSTPACP
jgi:hypothetical protein